MPVKFQKIQIGGTYDRNFLAREWGYQSFQALGRGIFTPSGDNKIILFVTKEKQNSSRQYADHFEDELLYMDGEDGHGSDTRLVNAATAGDEVHLFYRDRHHSEFTYYGQVFLKSHELRSEPQDPSRFVYTTDRNEVIAASSLETEQETHRTEEMSSTSDEEFEGLPEGERSERRRIAYRREVKNRAAAIRIHGNKCIVCEFDFDAFYGADFARGFIEVHHRKSVTVPNAKVNPRTDLVPICSNCHSMAHRYKGRIISVEDLREIVRRARR